jgi:hypothetical protein
LLETLSIWQYAKSVIICPVQTISRKDLLKVLIERVMLEAKILRDYTLGA